MRELLTSHSQACWKERMQKETAVRVVWSISCGHKYPKERSVLRKQLQQGAPRPALGTAAATSSPDNKEMQGGWPETEGGPESAVQGSECLGSPTQGGQSLGGPRGPDRAGGLGNEVRAPNPLLLLFRGTSHEGQARALCLRERHRQKPQEKYRHPVLSSWEYGWHVGDAVKDIQAPTYGKSKPITKSCYIRSGIFHCPR